MVVPRNGPYGVKMMRLSMPFPENRPDLRIEGFTLKPEDLEDEIFLVPEYADELLPEGLRRAQRAVRCNASLGCSGRTDDRNAVNARKLCRS